MPAPPVGPDTDEGLAAGQVPLDSPVLKEDARKLLAVLEGRGTGVPEHVREAVTLAKEMPDHVDALDTLLSALAQCESVPEDVANAFNTASIHFGLGTDDWLFTKEAPAPRGSGRPRGPPRGKSGLADDGKEWAWTCGNCPEKAPAGFRYRSEALEAGQAHADAAHPSEDVSLAVRQRENAAGRAVRETVSRQRDAAGQPGGP